MNADRSRTSCRCCSRTASAARRRRIAAARNAQTALPLPYTETRLVEETPTTAQVKHTLVIGSRWVNQASLGFSRLSVPIVNATIDGRYPIEAGLRGLPAGEADSAFPEIAFAGPNAPTHWRGTDARAFTEYLNNYTLQNNLQWTLGRHAMTFGFQAQRMDANERERTYGSLATFGFSNAQTAGFSADRARCRPTTGNAYASFLLGDLNATNVIEDSEVATSGRFYTYAFWAQDDFKVTAESVAQPRPALRHHEAVHGGLRPLVVHEPGAAEPRRRRLSAARSQFAGYGAEQLPVPHADRDLLRRRRSAPRLRLQR